MYVSDVREREIAEKKRIPLEFAAQKRERERKKIQIELRYRFL